MEPALLFRARKDENMYKHLCSKKICRLLALSLAISLSSICAAEEAPAELTAIETAATSETVPEGTATHYSLNFDTKSFRKEVADLNGQPFAFRVSERSRYTAYPAAMDREKLDLYIPEAYFHKKSINGFTAKTAPVFMPLTLNSTEEITISKDESQNLILQALEHGYVVAVPSPLILQPAENERLGKAPLYLLEAKAAIRYLRRNHHRLPAGDLNRIVVTGQGLGGALALQLAASCNQEDYYPYLQSLGSAERSDHIFAAQAYEPELDTVQDASAYNWLLPDGRPDPYAVSRYMPLVNLKDTLERSATSPNIDSAIARIVTSDDSILKTMDGTIAVSDNNASPKNAKAKEKISETPTTVSKAPKIIYDTKEYRDFLARETAYKEAGNEYRQLLLDNLPPSQNAEYLRMCISSENNAAADSSSDLKTAFEETGTTVETQYSAISPGQDIKTLFAWIDATDAQQDVIDQKLDKLKKKQEEKLARARFLMERASAKAQKKQASIERQAARNGGSVPYATVKPN